MTYINALKLNLVEAAADAIRDLPAAPDSQSFESYLLGELVCEDQWSAIHNAINTTDGRGVHLVLFKQPLTNDEQRETFLVNSKMLYHFDHPNIAPLYHAGVTADGIAYLVTERFEGSNLRSLLTQQGCLDHEQFFDIFTQVGEAISYSHSRNAVFLDLNPSNVYVSRGENGSRVVKILATAWRFLLHGHGSGFLPTDKHDVADRDPAYTCPEYFQNETAVNKTADIYTLGLLMYEALCGVSPFAADSKVQTILNQIHKRPQLLDQQPGVLISKELRLLIMRTLEKQPIRRFRSIEDIVMRLKVMGGMMRPNARFKSRRLIERYLLPPSPTQNSTTAVLTYWIAIYIVILVPLLLVGQIKKMNPQYHLAQQQRHIDRADLAMLRGNWQDTAYQWKLAISEAEQAGQPLEEIGELYWRAGESVMTQVTLHVDGPGMGFGMGGGAFLSTTDPKVIAAHGLYQQSFDMLKKADKLGSHQFVIGKLADYKHFFGDHDTEYSLRTLMQKYSAPPAYSTSFGDPAPMMEGSTNATIAPQDGDVRGDSFSDAGSVPVLQGATNGTIGPQVAPVEATGDVFSSGGTDSFSAGASSYRIEPPLPPTK